MVETKNDKPRPSKDMIRSVYKNSKTILKASAFSPLILISINSTWFKQNGGDFSFLVSSAQIVVVIVESVDVS